MHGQTMKSNDGAFLYVLFTFQFLTVLIGVPLLIYSVATKEKRASVHKPTLLIKLLILCFVAKWLTDTHELVMLEAQRASEDAFDPYRVLQLENDGSFDTREIKQAYKTLAKKYHPDSVNTDIVSMDKAQRQWYNLVKAYETLTKRDKFDNYKYYGDPDGSMALRALELAMPSWFVGDEMRPFFIPTFFAALVLAGLALKIWTAKNEN